MGFVIGLIIIVLIIYKVIKNKNQKNIIRDQQKHLLKQGNKYSDTIIREDSNTISTTEFYDEEIETELQKINQEIEEIQYIKTAYTPKWMFTQHEKRAYYQLREIAKNYNLIVFAKVRLFDLVTPIKSHPKYKTNLYKIQAKHVDFVLAKNNLVAKYIVELDDSSHDRPDRKARDKFVDTVLTTCGYKVLHTREIKESEIINFINT